MIKKHATCNDERWAVRITTAGGIISHWRISYATKEEAEQAIKEKGWPDHEVVRAVGDLLNWDPVDADSMVEVIDGRSNDTA